MKTAVISYSLTENNDRLAKSIAEMFKLDHIRITEEKKRSNAIIALDMLLGRTPKTKPSLQVMDQYDKFIFLAPIWMGKVASPLRAYLKHLKSLRKSYAFYSISGGALGPNPKVGKELQKMTGKKMSNMQVFLIVDLIGGSRKPTSEETSNYRLSDQDIHQLSMMIKQALEKA